MIGHPESIARRNMEQVRLENTGGTGRKPYKYDGGTRTLFMKDQLIIDFHAGVIPTPKSTRLYNELLRSTKWEQHAYHFGRNQGLSNKFNAVYMDREIIEILCKRTSINYRGGHVVIPIATKGKGGLVSQCSMKIQPWPKGLVAYKEVIEKSYGRFRYGEAKYYPDGTSGMGYHRDHESNQGGPIVSISLGATRRFLFKHTSTKEVVEFSLRDGDVLVMRGRSQDKWRHTLAKQTSVKEPRINITLRKSFCGMTEDYFGEYGYAHINRPAPSSQGRDLTLVVDGDVVTIY